MPPDTISSIRKRLNIATPQENARGTELQTAFDSTKTPVEHFSGSIIDAAKQYFTPDPNKVRIRDVVREAVPQIAETIKSLARTPVTAAMIPADLLSTAVTGKPLPPLKIPGFGEAKSYSARALDYQKEPGYTPITAGARALSEGILDVATLGSIAENAGIGTQDLGKKIPPKGTVEQLSEEHGGWKPGMKQEFDTALANKDATTIQKLLPDVPKDYQTKFANEINNIHLEGLSKAPESVTLYRGENATNAGGTHFTTNPEWAKNFGDNSLQGSLPKGAKVYTLQPEDIQQAVQSGAKNETEVWKSIFDKGYDAIVGSDAMGSDKLDVIVKPNLLKNFTSELDKEITKETPAIAKTSEPVFKGFSDLTTKILDRLKGKTTTSKQEILDFTNMSNVKQSEKDLFRSMLEGEPDTISVNEFANKVKTELLPLQMDYAGSRYESVSLPSELRGPIANYDEHIYQSPIKTSAGSVHYSHPNADVGTENYFAHTRVEDLAAPNTERYLGDIAAGKKNLVRGKLGDENAGDTRRVIELQSDLFQKGNLEREQGGHLQQMIDRADERRDAYFTGRTSEYTPKAQLEKELADRKAETAKLEPYRNTWHERVIREEVKQAAKDGKTKLQFPTGETAMKIEGLGNAEQFNLFEGDRVGAQLTPNTLKVGQEVLSGNTHAVGDSYAENVWIITRVDEGGKFQAVPKNMFENVAEESGKYPFPDDAIKALQKDTFPRSDLQTMVESFDISGKVDKNNPIYKFYEKEVGRYLKNKYGATLVTDAQGVKWYEVNIKPEQKKLPVEAFGVGLGVGQQLTDTKSEDKKPVLK